MYESTPYYMRPTNSVRKCSHQSVLNVIIHLFRRMDFFILLDESKVSCFPRRGSKLPDNLCFSDGCVFESGFFG